MPERIEITILDKGRQGDDKKTAAIPSRRRRRLGRRRGASWLEIYDCGSLANGDDIPIVKTPGYTVSLSGGAVTYTLDQFGTADYQAFTDSLFDVPVANWHTYYRLLPWESLPDAANFAYTSFPSNFQLTDKDGDWVFPFRTRFDEYTETNATSITSDPAYHTFPTHYQQMKANNGINHYTDRFSYAGLPYIWGGTNGLEMNQRASYFPFSTASGSKWGFKVTTTNDPDAADIGEVVPSGPTRIFLMPHIGLWACVSTSEDLLTRDILGPVWQVNPRKNWPAYVDREYYQTEGSFTMNTDVGGTTLGSGYINDPGGLAAAFLTYQAGRSGMQASRWTLANAIDSRTTASVSTIDPADFNYHNSFYSALIHSPTGGVAFNGSNTANYLRGDTIFTYGGSRFYEMSEPFLSAVVWTGGTFYYCWIILQDGEPSLSAANYSRQLIDKYELHIRYDEDLIFTYEDDARLGG